MHLKKGTVQIPLVTFRNSLGSGPPDQERCWFWFCYSSNSLRTKILTDILLYVRQGCDFGLDVSVSRRSRDLPNASSRSRIARIEKSANVSVSVSPSRVSYTSKCKSFIIIIAMKKCSVEVDWSWGQLARDCPKLDQSCKTHFLIDIGKFEV